MFFLGLRVLEGFVLTLTILAIACAAIWFVRRYRTIVRIPITLLSAPIALLAALFIGLQVVFLGCESSSVPLYSPDHTKLVRVITDDAGALGGSSGVELLTHHGFSSTYIYRGGWKTLDIEKDARWLDDTHLVLQHDPYQFHDCTSTKKVIVRCTEKASPTPTTSLKSPSGNTIAELHTAKDGTYQGTDAVILTGKIGYAFVYVGAPASVVWEQTHWLDDQHLLITTKSDPKACANQIGINVTCKVYAPQQVQVGSPLRPK